MDHTLRGLVGFARALRNSGMHCGPGRVQAFLTATEQLDLADRAQLYWAGRLTLCADPEDLPLYDAAFDSWFVAPGDGPSARPPRREPTRRRSRTALLADTDGERETGDAEELSVAASEAEVLRRRDLADLGAAEREHLRHLLAELDVRPPRRRGLRQRPAPRGTLDPRATLRALVASGGEPVRLPKRSHATRARRVVLLVDVSGSMEPYADALLRFAHVVARRAPASTEVVTLGTRMTRVSRQLRQRDADRALAAASRVVPDFSGGTRLGETLRAFLDRWGQRGLARRAVVVLFSDGWERGDPTLLGEQMHRLHRLAHAVVWANPHAGNDDYRPVQSGIREALPWVDRFVAGHSLEALREVWRTVLDLAGSSPARSEVRSA
ncbi:VWA domain-containing protein [Allosaccharopolyspora coralli]|uniref:VWA domain-containing protein n=1 Tax=Allosaccharopolyspora coralli TaxID=2665642 RepID=A0A5Q3QAN8_9PSEU|nr:VWA domain-containing protein [Allosaccharopolyspora coralli]QGK68535.1 VWA domain-containing protein [Allosaccharopolyspora coralli]